MTDDPNDPWMTLAEIADELRVNPSTVRAWVSKGQLKASRAGVRKWIVRRSDLQTMLAATNEDVDAVLERAERGEPLRLGEHLLQPPEPEPQPDPPRSRPPKNARERGAVEFFRRAILDFTGAMDASRDAPPSPGYLDRLTAIAEACESVATHLQNASQIFGVQWRSNRNMSNWLPYELQQGGNRLGSNDLWADFDAAFDRLSITATGTDTMAVVSAFRGVRDTLLVVIRELESGSPDATETGDARTG